MGFLRASSFISDSSLCLSITNFHLFPGEEASSMQDSAKTISVAIQNYLRWNENEESGNTQEFSN
jgi:hypothetical protein